MQITHDQLASEDLVQDLFEKLWEKRIQFEYVNKLKAYLYNGTRNGSISFLRKQRNAAVDIPVDDYEEYIVDDDGEEALFKEEVYRQLFMVVNELPERQRQVFLLLMEGHKNEDIAQILQLSIETVRTHRKRAIAFLREHLSEEQFLFFITMFSLEVVGSPLLPCS